MRASNFAVCCILAAGITRGEPAPSMPEFQEVYQILSTNLAGAGSEELDRAAARGLVHELGPRAGLVGEGESCSNGVMPAEWRIFDNSIAYFRVGAVTSNLPGVFRAAYREMAGTNKGGIKGLALDLRFAGGFDYAAAAEVADCFLSSEEPLLDWRSGSARATIKTNAITIPVAVLVNFQTVGAAEALAAVLRDRDVGLVLGGQTAGRADIFKEFPLRSGGKLRVAVALVSYGSGKTLSRGVTPDIAINTSLEDERAYLRNPYKILHLPQMAKRGVAATDVLEEPRINEEELMREQREEEEESEEAVVPDAPEAPFVADPALARALDLLKGLSVVQPNRPG